jgi:threonine dehydrogenase-like Zn-dependent dehydrogenase
VGVAETGPWCGRRVVGEINCVCGTCRDCRGGRRNHCPNRTVLGIVKRDGAFADFVRLPQENLHLVPDDVSDTDAVFAEPLAAAFRIGEQIPLVAGQVAIVLGDGRLGNLCAQVLRLADCRVTVVGKHERKLTVLSQLGIATAKLDDFRERRCSDLVVDCTGSPSGLPLALEVVRPRGTIVLKTTVAGEQTLALAPVVIDEVTIVGSRCGPFGRALEALARREVDVAALCDGVAPLEEGVAALDRARSKPVLKLLLAVDPGFGRG